MAVKGSILVTGAASGIGRATALLLAERGFGAYAADLPSDALDNLSRVSNILPIQMDITDDVAVNKAYKFINAQSTELFALMNNGSISYVSVI